MSHFELVKMFGRYKITYLLSKYDLHVITLAFPRRCKNHSVKNQLPPFSILGIIRMQVVNSKISLDCILLSLFQFAANLFAFIVKFRALKTVELFSTCKS